LVALRSPAVEDGFDIVSVGVQGVGGVVARVVVGAFSGAAVVAAAGVEGCLMEAVNCFSVGCGEGDVERGGRRSLVEHEVFTSCGAERDHAWLEFDHPAVPGRERCLVEASARLQVADGDREVVDKDWARPDRVNLPENPANGGACIRVRRPERRRGRAVISPVLKRRRLVDWVAVNDVEIVEWGTGSRDPGSAFSARYSKRRTITLSMRPYVIASSAVMK
jgi:hypothetical protein